MDGWVDEQMEKKEEGRGGEEGRDGGKPSIYFVSSRH